MTYPLALMTSPSHRCFPQSTEDSSNPNTQPGTIVDDLEQPFRRYLAIDPHLPLVLALWALATHLFDCFDAFAQLAITSPTKRCGKTRVAELLEFVVANPLRTVGISVAALFRTIEKKKPTLLLDEAESLRGRDDRANALREILNAGYRKGQKVLRCVGEDYKPKEFDTYCPKVIVLIGSLADTTADRSIPVEMKRRTAEKLERFRFDKVKMETAPLRAAAKRWARANRAAVESWYTQNDVACLVDGEEELWLPLFAVCAVAAPQRLSELTCVAEQISGAKAASESGDPGIKLLANAREIFTAQGATRLSTADLLAQLKKLEESPWLGWSQGRGIDSRSLSHLLRPFGIHPQNLRIGDSVVKGYSREDFEDAWARYLPPASSRYNATRPVNTGENGDAASATACATDSATQSGPNGRSASVADL